LAANRAANAAIVPQLAKERGVNQRRVVLITLGVMMSLFLASMESTIIATAMPTIVGQLGGLESYSWVFAIYMLTSTTVGPIFGKLSDVYGRRPLYMIAIAIFAFGSLLCGIAASLPQLIAARAIQGIGAGGLMPLAFIIVGDIFTLEQRAKVQGLFSGVWGVSSVAGPLIGGFLVDRVSWHWVFLINLPAAAIAAALVWTAWSGVARPTGARPAVDYAGAALLSVGVVTLLLGLDLLGSPGSLPLLSVAAVTLAALVWVELRAPSPILPLRLFRWRLFAVACAHGLLAGWVIFGGTSYVPLFVQGVLGKSATEAGSTLTPMLLGWVLASIIASRLLLKINYRILVITGMTIFLVGTALLTRVRPDMGQAELMVALALMGMGMGASIPAFLISVQSTVDKSNLGAATATVQFSRTIGGTLGVAVLGVLLSSRITAALIGQGLDPASVPLDALLAEGGPGAGALGEQARLALASALSQLFASTLVVAALAFGATLLAPRLDLGSAARRESAEEAAVAAD
jgi:EmrB/QacA subfamily drug resistance transporter